NVQEFHLRLFSVVGAREYDLPTSGTLGAIVFENGPNTRTDYDVIIESKGGFPQRVNKLHPSYMSFQFPLLFVYGKPGFHPQMKQRRGVDKRLSMNQYYMFQLHERLDFYALLFRGGRLFQQYVVGVFCSIEQNRLDYYRLRQNDIIREYLSGVHDAISRGDREGFQVGGRLILPRTFTGGPRYMYSHYLDALAICRALGNPQYFVTFMCNVNWPEIKRHMLQFPELTPADKADIVKRGVPHCHTLVWVDSKDKIQNASEVDRYISAKLPDSDTDPEGYRVVSEMMVHSPCGLLHPDVVGDPPTDTNNGSIQIDEIQNYIDGRFVCPHKACWRILKYDIHCRQPAVQILSVHLEGVQPVTFRDHQPLTLIVNDEGKTKTTLTEWLEYKKLNGDGLHLSYIDFTKEFSGLLGDDKEWHIVLEEEAASSASSQQLRSLFVQILIFCDVADPMRLWKAFWRRMSNDVPRTVSNLLHIQELYMNDPEL
ncbi:DNA helicase, partial [Tanacetum coccineum]